MSEVHALDGLARVEMGQVLDEAVVAPCVSPAFDAANVPGHLALLGCLVCPDVAVACDADFARVGVCYVAADIQGRSPIYRLFEGSCDTREFDDVVTPFSADHVFAVATGDAAKDVVHEGCVADRVGNMAGDGAVRGLLEVHEALCSGRGFDAIADFHAASGQVAQKVPPFRVVGKGGIGDTSNKARHVEELVDLG